MVLDDDDDGGRKSIKVGGKGGRPEGITKQKGHEERALGAERQRILSQRSAPGRVAD